MIQTLYDDAQAVIKVALSQVKPDAAVQRALQSFQPGERTVLVSVGKAAWQMAAAAEKCLPGPLAGGIVITKYGHVKHPLPGIECYEAAHPVPDEQGFAATETALRMVEQLNPQDTVLFLLSGAPVEGEGRTLRPGLCACEGVQHRSERRSGRSAGYDRQRPGCAGHLHLCAGGGHCKKIPAEAFAGGAGAAGAGDPQAA